jgi:hypothetical protein
METSVLRCDGKCQYSNYPTITTWLCDGVCQNVTKPCHEKCPDIGHTHLNCHGLCEEIPSVFHCQNQCQSIDLPCNQTTCFNDWDQQETVKDDSENGSNIEPMFWKCPNESRCINTINICDVWKKDTGTYNFKIFF